MAASRFLPPATGEAKQAFADVSKALDDRTLLGSYPLALGATLTVSAGEFRRVSPRSSGMSVALPAADGSNIGEEVTLFVEGSLGALTVKPVSGTVDGAGSISFGVGTYVVRLRSNGNGRWATSANTLASLGQIQPFQFLGRNSSGLGPVEVLGPGTAAQVVRMNDAGTFLGFFTVSTAAIANSAVTNAKLANMAANTVKVNATAGAAVPTDFALAANELLGRAAGNITGLAAATQSAMFRGSGALGFGAAAADTCLQRVGSADLAFSATPRLLRAPQILTSGTTINHPTGTRLIVVEGVAGGGASGGLSATAGSIGGGGGSGTYGRKTYTAAAASSTYVIGTAGTGVSGANGNPGGNASFTHNSSTMTLPGGGAGAFAAGAATVAATAGGGTAAAATNADFSITGQGGGDSMRPAAATTPCMAGAGGSNPLGSGGPSKWTGTTQLAALAPTGFGSGGPGRANGTTLTAAAGNNGAPGCFIVWEFS